MYGSHADLDPNICGELLTKHDGLIWEEGEEFPQRAGSALHRQAVKMLRLQANNYETVITNSVVDPDPYIIDSPGSGSVY